MDVHYNIWGLLAEIHVKPHTQLSVGYVSVLKHYSSIQMSCGVIAKQTHIT